MSQQPIFASYAGRLREFIESREASSVSAGAAGREDDDAFTSLALDLFRLHRIHNPAYRAWCRSREVSPGEVADWRDIPAVPAVAFKEMEMTLLRPGERAVVFRSSGTSGQTPGRHFHDDASLGVYEASLLPWFEAHLLPRDRQGRERFTFIALTPPPALAPHSSLVYMFETIRRRHAPGQAMFAGRLEAGGGWGVNGDELMRRLGQATEKQEPLVLLGTAFNFVHLLDEMAARGVSLRLPAGSRVMETGGYKGRSRELPRAELHALITARLGIPPGNLVCEYGMCELSSQAYDRVVDDPAAPASPRIFRFPPWARARILSPETGSEVEEGEPGLVCVLDLANVVSAPAVQTGDLARRHGDGFELLGRASDAGPRGCSLRSF